MSVTAYKNNKMSLFLSSYENRIDAKGRVSVPAKFRTAIANDDFQGVILYRSPAHNCIEGVSMSHMQKLANEDNNKFDDLFADAQQMNFDVTGRIIITPELKKHANLKDNALFIGRGNSFQIWNPDNFRKTCNFQPIIQKK